MALSLDELEAQLLQLGDKVAALQVLGPEEGMRCTAEFPHAGELSYRGAGRYVCRCRQRYAKDGQGGLREDNG